MRSSLKVWISLCGVLAIFLLIVMPALAGPIPGANNEVVNGGFDNSNTATGVDGKTYKVPADWVSTGVLNSDATDFIQPPSGITGGNPPPAPRCTFVFGRTTPHTLRQIVDDSTGKLWNPKFHAKTIDLQADIMGWELGSTPGSLKPLSSTAAISFRLDWWDERYNGVSSAGDLPQPSDPFADSLAGAPAGYGQSAWVTYTFSKIPGYVPGTWLTVNPFDQNTTLFANFQPKWVSIEIKYTQGGNDVLYVDNVDLTSKCTTAVPEPSTLLLLGSGLAGLVGFGRKRLLKV